MTITRLIFLLFAPVCVLFCEASYGIQKTGDPIALRNEKLNFTPHEFYIADIADERNDRSSVALLIVNKDTSHSSLNVDLKGGAAVSIKNFLSNNLHTDTSLRPVILTIKEFKITENNATGGRVSGHLAIVFSFGLQLSYQTIHLMDYKSGIRYNRPDGQYQDVEPILREGIEDALSYFNNWINSHADNNTLLAKSVKVKFADYSEKPEGDTIYYSPDRPLTWADFKDKPRDNRFEAEVFTSIGYIEKIDVIKGVINVNLIMKVDAPKSDCWVREGGRDDYILNHEQRHFDIAKLVSEHFKEKIGAMKLPVENFDGPINVQYLETLREATAMQKQYDTETRHGQDKQAQEQWNKKIDEELRAYGVKK